MALHYIVDGYNVIKKTPFLDHRKLKDARDALLDFIYKNRPHGSQNNQITVVFDGRDDVFNFKQNYDFCILFTRNESADDLIKSLIDKAEHPKNIVVVSEDRDIQLYCRPRGARISTVSEFLDKGRKKAPKLITGQDDAQELSLSERKRINDELSKLWLKQRNI